MTYSEYSHGDIHFKLPTGFFEYQGVEDGDATYYGKNIPGYTCCDVIISESGFGCMGEYNLYDNLINEYPDTYNEMIKQVSPFRLRIQRGKTWRIIESIVEERTLNLWVKAGAGNYFKLTVGRSYDKSVTISQLREFAYEILDTIKITGGGHSVSFEGFSDNGKEEETKRIVEEKRKAEEAKRVAEEKCKAEEAKRVAVEKHKAEEAKRVAEEKRKAEEKSKRRKLKICVIALIVLAIVAYYTLDFIEKVI